MLQLQLAVAAGDILSILMPSSSDLIATVVYIYSYPFFNLQSSAILLFNFACTFNV
jgi:hypothetical protein